MVLGPHAYAPGMAEEGKCALGGAFNEPCDGAVVLCDAESSNDAARLRVT